MIANKRAEVETVDILTLYSRLTTVTIDDLRQIVYILEGKEGKRTRGEGRRAEKKK